MAAPLAGGRHLWQPSMIEMIFTAMRVDQLARLWLDTAR